MFEDILGPRKKKKPKARLINWDIDKYIDQAYCYNCGSTDLDVTDDVLKSDKMFKNVECLVCGCSWKEVWNKDIDLELFELWGIRTEI